MLMGRKITVLGAGVAGLAVARALALRGAQVELLERADSLSDIGAGLQISPNGARVLDVLGLGDALRATGPSIHAVDLRNGESDTPVAHLPMGRLRPDAPYHFVHRARLIDLLAKGARDAGVQIRLLQSVADVTLDPDGPVLKMAQGQELRPGLLIGADGLHSKVRTALNGRVAPFFTHQVAWRGLIEEDPDAPPVAEVFMGAKKHVTSYPLAGGLRNIVAVEERSRWAEESWHLRDDPMSLRVAFNDFCPRVRGWLERIEAPYLWGLFRHPVAPRWHGPRCVIIGDAVHPTLPFMAQGANMALEDAWILAQSLSQHEDDNVAFAAYQAARQVRCEKIVKAAQGNARNYHLSGVSRAVGHLGLQALSRMAPHALLGRYDWIYDYDATAALQQGSS